MAKFPDRLPFTPKGEFVVIKRGMKFGGKTWEYGEDFPVNRLAIGHRRLRVLYDGRFITMKGDLEDAQPDEPEDKNQTPGEVVAGDGEFVYDPAVHSIEHEGSEYWIVDDETDFVRVRAPMGKKLDTATEKTLVTADDILAWAEDD